MRKTMGIALISALVIISCQKKEETSTKTQEIQPPVVSQPQESSPPQPQESSVGQEKKETVKDESKDRLVDGKGLFASKGCGSCHQESVDTVGPSLKKIASVYQSDKTKLTAFLKGEAKAIVDPAKEAIMKPQLEITKKMTKEELEGLVDFILKH